MVFTILFFTIALASLIIIMLTRFPFRRGFYNKNSALQLIGGFTSKAEFKSVCIETPAWRKFIEVPVPSREVFYLAIAIFSKMRCEDYNIKFGTSSQSNK